MYRLFMICFATLVISVDTIESQVATDCRKISRVAEGYGSRCRSPRKREILRLYTRAKRGSLSLAQMQIFWFALSACPFVTQLRYAIIVECPSSFRTFF